MLYQSRNTCKLAVKYVSNLQTAKARSTRAGVSQEREKNYANRLKKRFAHGSFNQFVNVSNLYRCSQLNISVMHIQQFHRSHPWFMKTPEK